MSWGGPEYFGETSDDTAHFLQSGVTFVASSGDSGAPPSYPAASANIHDNSNSISGNGNGIRLINFGTATITNSSLRSKIARYALAIAS